MSSRKAGLGAVATRTRGEAREDAGKIRAETDEPIGAPEPVDDAAASVASDLPATDDGGGPGAEPERPDTPAAPVSTRGRKRKSSLPSSLTPSRVSQRRIQIGPRLRPAIHTEFDGYARALAPMGFTQSDLVESALVEYMERYPVEAVRAALLEGQ